MGKSGESKKNREKLRWIRNSNENAWQTQVEMASEFRVQDANVFYRFCKEKGDADYVLAADSGIINGQGTFDSQNRQASIEWTRPFDVPSDRTLTLQGGKAYKVWMNWGVFNGDRDKAASKIKGDRSYEDG